MIDPTPTREAVEAAAARLAVGDGADYTGERHRFQAYEALTAAYPQIVTDVLTAAAGDFRDIEHFGVPITGSQWLQNRAEEVRP